MKTMRKKRLDPASQGSVSMEQTVLVSAVAVGVASALVPIGRVLFAYHSAIEFILALPIP